MIMAVGMAALGAMLLVLVRARPRVRPAGVRGLHGDQGGAAAIEMAFVFPLGLMIFLLVIQAALVFNANMVVHYAAFAAARMTIVVVPLNLANDPTFPEKRNWVRNPDVASVPKSEKLEMIRRSAIMAVMPISAKASGGLAPLDAGGTAVQNESSAAFRTLGVKDQRPWFYMLKSKPTYQGLFHNAKSQYDYANSEITSSVNGAVKVTEIELAKPKHWREGDRNEDCPSRQQRRGTWGDWGWNWVSYCPTVNDNGVPDGRMDYSYARWNTNRGYWYEEEMHVRVTYQFLLEMPYANRFMGDEAQVPGRTGKQYVTQIRVVQSFMNEGEPELKPLDYQWPPGT